MILRAHIICNNLINGLPPIAHKYRTRCTGEEEASARAVPVIKQWDDHLLLVHDIKDEFICFDTEQGRWMVIERRAHVLQLHQDYCSFRRRIEYVHSELLIRKQNAREAKKLCCRIRPQETLS